MSCQIDIIKFLPDATFAIDQDKRVIAWNMAMEKMTGAKSEHMLGRDDYSLLFYDIKRPLLIDLVFEPEEEVKKLYDIACRIENSVYAEGFVSQARRGNGAYFWGIASPILDNNGNIAGTVESMRDITENRKLQKALKASEERYRALLNDTSDIIWETDTKGIFRFVNARTITVLGYKPEEMIGKPVFKFLNPVTVRNNRRQFTKFIKTKKPLNTMENSFLHKNGSLVAVETKAIAAYDSGGAWLGFQGIDRDITERKKAEDERENLILELQQALSEIKVLSGMLPICSVCKKIRNDEGYWEQIENYIRSRSDAEFSHGICPDCAKKLYPEFYKQEE